MYHEIKSADMYALDRHIIRDLIEHERDFEGEFSSYRPVGAIFHNQTSPDYINPINYRVDPVRRHELSHNSITALECHCYIANLVAPMLRFHNDIHGAVAHFRKWPSKLREMCGSLYF